MNRYWILLATTLVAPVYAQVIDPAAGPDTSLWKCKNCETYEGWIGSVDFGIRTVSEESVDFGRYNGLEDNGVSADIGTDLSYYGDSGQAWDLRVRDIGLDNRQLLLDGGHQGVYRFRLQYDVSEVWGADDAQTPYRGNEGQSLTLPAGWVRGGSTASMNSLAAALGRVDLRHDRQALAVGVDMVASRQVEYSVDYRRETREGGRALAGGFLFDSTQFVAPIDSVTDTLKASLTYAGKDWAASVSYLGSYYGNDADSVEWDNPYASNFGADTGRVALSPDNTFHQLAVSANYRFSKQSRLYANLAVGQGSQHDSFLPYTSNTSLTTTALPRSNLAGRVDTVTAVARYSHQPAPPWRLNAEVRLNDRYNKSAQADYTYVVTDAIVNSTSQTNLPYGFKDRDLRLDAEYRMDRHAKLAVGLDTESRERTFQAVEKTDENTVWAKGSYRVGGAADFTLKVARSERDATESATPPVLTSADNPLLRKYNTADRSREAARLHVNVQASDSLTLGLDSGYSEDDYEETSIGLTNARSRDQGFDLNYLVSEHAALYGAYSLQTIRSNQVGNEGGGSTNWQINEKDTVETISLGVSYTPPKTTLKVGADITQSVSHGRIMLDRSGTESEFPLLKMAFEQFRVYGVYPWNKSIDIAADLVYELGNADDWAVDDVEAGTIANVLSLGTDSIDYKVWTAFVAVRYRFGAASE